MHTTDDHWYGRSTSTDQPASPPEHHRYSKQALRCTTKSHASSVESRRLRIPAANYTPCDRHTPFLPLLLKHNNVCKHIRPRGSENGSYYINTYCSDRALARVPLLNALIQPLMKLKRTGQLVASEVTSIIGSTIISGYDPPGYWRYVLKFWW